MFLKPRFLYAGYYCNGDVSARDYAHVMLIYDELLLTEFKPPL